jgi:hypothetical protein
MFTTSIITLYTHRKCYIKKQEIEIFLSWAKKKTEQMSVQSAADDWWGFCSLMSVGGLFGPIKKGRTKLK